MRPGLLAWGQYRYGKVALLVALLSLVLYISQGHGAAQPANGGTWQGYLLGGVGVGLIIWLSLLGVRKRSYRSRLGTVQGWSSAHVWLGSVLLLVVTLHCAAQFGWNVHTLAYALLCLVIISGFYGLYVYAHVPTHMSRNSAGQARDAWLEELSELDGQIRATARGCDAELQAMAISAVELTRLGGGLSQQLSARDRSTIKMPQSSRPVANAGQRVILDALAQRIPVAEKKSEAQVMNELLALFGRRQVILQRLRQHIQAQGLLRIWLYFHVPLTVALLAALLVHVLTVFLYW